MNKNYPCYKTGEGIKCEGSKNCILCGFNPEEGRIRKEYIKRYGLTKTAKGTSQLVMKLDKRKNIEKRLGLVR